MPGFNISIGKDSFSQWTEDSAGSDDLFVGDTYQVSRDFLKKFEGDKIFYKSESFLIVLDGVVLNKKNLMLLNEQWHDSIIRLYRSLGDTFFRLFRGTFNGILFDIELQKWIIFTDHFATKHLYYLNSKNGLLASSELSNFFRLSRMQIDTEAAYMLLSYGYMLNDKTLIEGVRKLQPGHYILIEQNIFSIKSYYRLPLSKIEKTFDSKEFVDELDQKFRNAITLQFEKDKEYGYDHLVGLSGGLDSRMTSWVANEMGYESQVNFTFSQSGYLDETIAKNIAENLKHEWIFKALDNGIFLKDIDEITRLTGGNVLYYGLAHANSLYKYLNFDRFGIVHTGQLGDVIVGSFIKSLSQSSLMQLGGAYSTKFLKKLKNSSIQFDSHSELENALLYQRGFNGANNGLLSTQRYSETYSPFYDVDFFEYCLSIPINIRMNHGLYHKWILSKYPKAADYVWEATKRKITSTPLAVSFAGKKVLISNVSRALLRRVGILKNPVETRNHMNPLDYWYKSNEDLRAFQDDYFLTNKRLIHTDKDLVCDLEDLYIHGTASEKNQVLSLLAAFKLLSEK